MCFWETGAARSMRAHCDPASSSAMTKYASPASGSGCVNRAPRPLAARSGADWLSDVARSGQDRRWQQADRIEVHRLSDQAYARHLLQHAFPLIGGAPRSIARRSTDAAVASPRCP